MILPDNQRRIELDTEGTASQDRCIHMNRNPKASHELGKTLGLKIHCLRLRLDFGCLVIDNEECLLNIYILVLHVYLLRACKHTGIHIGGSSACPGLG